VRRDAGFTLIEIMVAIVILAGSLAVLFPALTNTLRQMRAAESRQTALLVGQSVLAALEAAPKAMAQQGVASGMRWQTSLLPEGTQVGYVAAYRAEVAVFLTAESRPVTLSTIVLGPAEPNDH
jgi:general secretion pathway protein I